MTTLELVDALEAGIAALRSHGNNRTTPVAAPQNNLRQESDTISPATLRAELDRYAISVADIAAATGVTRDDVEEWLRGSSPAPAWVSAVIRVTGLLPLSERSKLRRHAASTIQQRFPEHTHPFARIEDL